MKPHASDPPIRFGANETLPGPGAYLVLWYHHDGESHWCSLGQLWERIRVIRQTKPDAEERLARLTAVPWSEALASDGKTYDEAAASAASALMAYEGDAESALMAYDEDAESALMAYDSAMVPARKAYDKALASARKAFLTKVHIRRGNAVRIAARKEAKT